MTERSAERSAERKAEDAKSMNATTSNLEELNGLLCAELVSRIKSGDATSSDLNAAVRLLAHNRVAAENEAERAARENLEDIEFPFR